MIHNTAIIDKSAKIEENVSIGAYTVIGKNVNIGAGTVIGSNAYIEYAQIGKNCKISNSASIGTAPQDISYKDETTMAYIGDGTSIREFVTINRGTKQTEKTIIGKNCLFMMSSHVGHDCVVGDNVILTNCSCLGGHVHVDNNVFISAMSAVHQFSKIGRNVIIAAGTMVTMDIVPFAMCHGGSVGDRPVISGLNLVGLKRTGFKSEEIAEIKNAYKILFMSNKLLKDAVSELSQSKNPYVLDIVNFINNSKRGIARPGK